MKKQNQKLSHMKFSERQRNLFKTFKRDVYSIKGEFFPYTSREKRRYPTHTVFLYKRE